MDIAHFPPSFKDYFWDMDIATLDPKKHAFLIMKRVLDRGQTSDVQWVIKTYGEDAVKDLLAHTKDLSRPTAIYWATRLGVEVKNVLCLQKPYSRTHFGLSS